jgi:hypothetical protein
MRYTELGKRQSILPTWGRWRTAFNLAHEARKTQKIEASFMGGTVLINGALTGLRYQFLSRMSGTTLNIDTSDAQPSLIHMFRGLNILLKGLHHQSRPIIRKGVRKGIITSIDYLRVPQAYMDNNPGIVGLFENYGIPVNPNEFDLYISQVTRGWRSYVGLNRFDCLINTARAFLGLPPYEFDSFTAKPGYYKEAGFLLGEIYDHHSEEFSRFAKTKKEITFSRRYLPIIDVLMHYLNGENLLAHPAIKAFVTSELKWPKAYGGGEKIIRILEVGGAPYSLEHGAPAIRHVLEKLKQTFPDIRFEITVTDINFPEEFGIKSPGDSRPDNIYPEITYKYHDIITTPINDFDIAICSRVLTQEHFTGESKRAAIANLYKSIKPGGLLFLDQGEAPWMEIWLKRMSSVEKDRFLGLLNRIDLWFLVEQLEIFRQPKKYLKKYFNKTCNETERRIIAKYYPTLLDPDRSQAVLLWRLCIQNKGKRVKSKIKNVTLPRFLSYLRESNLGLRTRLEVMIDTLANPNIVDLSAIEELNGLLSAYRIPLEVDLTQLMKSKLELTGLHELIPEAIRKSDRVKDFPEGNFFELDGIIHRVEVDTETNQCVVSLKFLNWDPWRIFDIVIPRKEKEEEPYKLEQIKII